MAGEFVSSIKDRTELARVTRGFEMVIAASFAVDGSTPTAREVRRRFGICEEAYRMLRADFHWSVPRILDNLPKALRAKLDGIPWDPSKERAIWSPG